MAGDTAFHAGRIPRCHFRSWRVAEDFMLLTIWRLIHVQPRRRPIRRLRAYRLGRHMQLENRVLMSVANVGSGFFPLVPAQIRSFYGLNQVMFNTGSGQSINLDGKGQTVAVVDAYDMPTISNDVNVFSNYFGLPSASVQKATPQGQPAADTAGWSFETALDVEYAHAAAPGANILLVEAKSDSLDSLLGAVDYARQQAGVVSVSMSWGTSEWPGETNYDSLFTTPAGHQGVTFVAATGDSGSKGGPAWPAVSPNVVAVGGTSLQMASGSTTGGQESGWSGSGGGMSWYEAEPSYQKGVQSTGYRTGPDVSLSADPRSGVYVYDSYDGGWFTMGGTSAATPIMAGLIAVADQGRALQGNSSLDGPTQTLPALYGAAKTNYSANFNDITTGSNGFRAGRGYDLVTGLGSPHAPGLVATLMAVDGSTSGNLAKARAPRTGRHVAHTPSVATVSFVVNGDNGNGAPVIVTVPVASLANAIHPILVTPTFAPSPGSDQAARPAETPMTPAPPATSPTSALADALRLAEADHLFNVHASDVTPPDQGTTDTPTPQQQPGDSIKPAPAQAQPAAPVHEPSTRQWDAKTADDYWTLTTATSSDETTPAVTMVEPFSPLAAVLVVLGGYQLAPETAAEQERRPTL